MSEATIKDPLNATWAMLLVAEHFEARFGITHHQADVLVELGMRGTATVGELAQTFDRSHSAMSHFLTRLKSPRLGLVTEAARRNGEHRERPYQLTGRGRSLLARIEDEADLAWADARNAAAKRARRMQAHRTR